MPAVEINDVTKTFGDVTAVDNLSLSVPEGSVYGFIGPNGSGKSTTMRMIANIFTRTPAPSGCSGSRAPALVPRKSDIFPKSAASTGK